MATITAGNELYLYQLLSREAGTGRQIMIAQVEDILRADDIWPSDLGCSDVREVLEHLSSFVHLTVFKKGRVYATVIPNPEWDAILERAQADKTDKTAEKGGGAKSWKRKRAKRDPKPAKPRPKGRPKPAAEPEPAPEPTPEPMPAAEPEPAPEPARAATEEQAQGHAPAITPEPAPTDPAPTPSITFTITYDPYEDEENEGASDGDLSSTPEAPAAPIPAAPDTSVSPTSQTRHPQSFATDVLIRNTELSSLYQILPLDVDPIALLDEDWRVARSTHQYTQDGGIVTFPLRYQGIENNQPVMVTLRRTVASNTGKRWVVASITGIEETGLEGLPSTGDDTSRSLAQFAQLGPWDELTQSLERMIGDKTSTAGIVWSSKALQEYLTHTFRRIQYEDKFTTYDDGARGAFDTGLLTTDAQSILMCFEAAEGNIPWQFTGFLTSVEAQLSGPAPLPATYITALSDIVLTAETSVQVSKELARAYGPELQDAIDVAVRRTQRDYRLAAPAYDPIANKVRLLIPLRLADGEQRALVLCPADQGFVACATLSLERAAECTRVVSFELPRWLGYL